MQERTTVAVGTNCRRPEDQLAQGLVQAFTERMGDIVFENGGLRGIAICELVFATVVQRLKKGCNHGGI